MVEIGEELFEISTNYGNIEFRGRDTGRPLLLFITGVLADENQLNLVQQRFPNLDVLRAFLPANHCPPLVGVTIEIFAAAYTSAFDKRFAGRDVVVVGLSVGALVALGLRMQGVRELVLVEPILMMDEAWPLKALRTQAPPGYETFLWNILGIGSDSTEPRDYRQLLVDTKVPVLALLGDPPPPEGPWSGAMPGLVGPISRAALTAHPLTAIRDFPGVGHNIIRDAGTALLAEIQMVVERVFGKEASSLHMP